MKHRPKALEVKAAQDGILPNEAQIAAVEKAKADNQQRIQLNPNKQVEKKW